MRFTFPILTLSHGGAQRMLVELTNGLTDLVSGQPPLACGWRYFL